MSSDPSQASRLLDETRQQIRRLAAEIAGLARSDLAPQDFYREFLDRVVVALAAAGGVLWTVEDGRQLCIGHQVNLKATKLLEASEEDRAGHDQLIARAVSEDPMVVPPHTVGENGQGANPTGFLLVLGPIRAQTQTAGLVEIFQRPGAPPEVERGYLRFLTQMCGLAGDFFKGRKLRQLSDRQSLWTQLDQFADAVHLGLDPRRTAYTIANEGQRLVECDRLSVAVRKGRKCRIEAVSGQDTIDKRSNTVRLLAALATEAAASGQPIWFTGNTHDLAPQVERLIQEYVDETDVKTVVVLPLVRPKLDTEEDTEGQLLTEPAIGALVAEQIEDEGLAPEQAARLEAVCRSSTLALSNALEHENLFLMPVWRTLGRAGWLVRAKTLPKTAAVAGAIMLLMAWLLFWPADLEIHSKGTLEPVVRQDVFAGIDGRVERVLVDHRDRVRGPTAGDARPGTLLVVLRNHELDEEIARVGGQRLTVRQQIAATQRSLLETKLSVAERNRLSGELAQSRQELLNLDRQWSLLEQKQKELSVYSPIDGEVITWDVRNLLVERPVQRGERLLRVADPDGPWQVELHMPEDRMGHIVAARRQRREQFKAQLVERLREERPDADDEVLEAEAVRVLDEPSRVRLEALLGEGADPRLPVSFVLATDPGTSYEGRVCQIQASAEVRGEEGNTVLVKVEIDKSELPQLMSGAEVSAKIDCGRCSVGYDLFHDLIAWFERLWFRI